MAPTPSIARQRVVGRLLARLAALLAARPCERFVAPVDVKLGERDIVQPGAVVVCHDDQIAETHIDGAPRIVFEVLSLTTAARDLRDKKALGERTGVAVYVLIDPLKR